MTEHAWAILRDIVTLLILGVTVWAIIYGPGRAVFLQRDTDEKREAKRRQYGILHNLMKTRSWNLHMDHVMALNLIQLEFHGHDDVVDAYRYYRQHLSITVPTVPAENRQFEDDRKDRFYTLVKAIADVLGIEFDKADIERLAYAPQGWHDDVTQQNHLRALFIEVLSGRRPVPMSNFHISAVNTKFPDPPAPTPPP
jgi:hypothetical protein